MTEDALIAAALRNRGLREGQVTRLQPRLSEARRAEEAARSALKDVKEGKSNHELMQSLKCVPNFFPTPPKVIREMLDLIDIPLGSETVVCDPSAGKGDLLMSLRSFGCSFRAFEIVPKLAEIVQQKGFACGCADFLEQQPDEEVNLMFMNPPFERGADHRHVMHAYEWLRFGQPRERQLIACCSITTCLKLKDIATQTGGWIQELPAGSFANSERSTNVNTGIVNIKFT